MRTSMLCSTRGRYATVCRAQNLRPPEGVQRRGVQRRAWATDAPLDRNHNGRSPAARHGAQWGVPDTAPILSAIGVPGTAPILAALEGVCARCPSDDLAHDVLAPARVRAGAAPRLAAPSRTARPLRAGATAAHPHALARRTVLRGRPRRRPRPRGRPRPRRRPAARHRPPPPWRPSRRRRRLPSRLWSSAVSSTSAPWRAHPPEFGTRRRRGGRLARIGTPSLQPANLDQADRRADDGLDD